MCYVSRFSSSSFDRSIDSRESGFEFKKKGNVFLFIYIPRQGKVSAKMNAARMDTRARFNNSTRLMGHRREGGREGGAY